MQNTFNNAPARALAGMAANTFLQQFISRALASRQLVQLTFGATDGTYTVTVNGSVVASYVASSLTATQIRDAVLALLQASAAPVVSTASSTNKILMESNSYDPAASFTYAIATIAGYSASTLITQGETVPFGIGVCADDRADVTGKRCRLPRQATDVTGLFLGVAASNTAREPNSSVGWNALSMPNIMRVGHVWVVVEGVVTELQQLYCRYSASGSQQLGAFRADADSSTAALAPVRALEATTGAGIVLAEVCAMSF